MIFVSACGNGATNGTVSQRISLIQAEELVRTAIYEQAPDMNPAAQFPLEEITTDEIWKRLGVQVFKVTGDSSRQDYTYLIKGERVELLGIGFGGFGVTSMQVADLDRNNEPELIYIYSFGSGIHQSLIGAYCSSWLDDHIINSKLIYLYGDMLLDKTSDHEVAIKAGYFDIHDSFVTESTLGQLALTQDNGKPHLEVKLSNNLPRHVKERIETFSQ